jgi:hypothetical protein
MNPIFKHRMALRVFAALLVVGGVIATAFLPSIVFGNSPAPRNLAGAAISFDNLLPHSTPLNDAARYDTAPRTTISPYFASAHSCLPSSPFVSCGTNATQQHFVHSRLYDTSSISVQVLFCTWQT